MAERYTLIQLGLTLVSSQLSSDFSPQGEHELSLGEMAHPRRAQPGATHSRGARSCALCEARSGVLGRTSSTLQATTSSHFLMPPSGNVANRFVKS